MTSADDTARIREQLFGLHLLMLQSQRILTECDRQLDAISRGLESEPVDLSPVRTVTDCAALIPPRLSLVDENPIGPAG